MCVVIDNFVVRAIIAVIVVVFRIIAADAFIVIIVVIVIVITVIGFIDVTVIIIVFSTYASKLCERYNVIPILLLFLCKWNALAAADVMPIYILHQRSEP